MNFTIEDEKSFAGGLLFITVIILLKLLSKNKKQQKALMKSLTKCQEELDRCKKYQEEVDRYKETTYYKITHNDYSLTNNDAGIRGEYLTYIELRDFENAGDKILFNLYLPKVNGQSTELDLVMISSKCIFVIESKNYSGWIFGNERQKFWTQTLPVTVNGSAHKEKFLNPIMQNKLHITALKSVIGNDMPVYSIIAFSEKCTLRDITVYDDSIKVINRDNLNATINKVLSSIENRTTQARIDELFDILYPYTQVSESVKKRHIEEIKNGFVYATDSNAE